MTRTCAACFNPIPTGCAVLRGNGHEKLAFHVGCFTLSRAVAEIDAPTVAAEVGPLTRRMVLARIR